MNNKIVYLYRKLNLLVCRVIEMVVNPLSNLHPPQNPWLRKKTPIRTQISWSLSEKQRKRRKGEEGPSSKRRRSQYIAHGNQRKKWRRKWSPPNLPHPLLHLNPLKTRKWNIHSYLKIVCFCIYVFVFLFDLLFASQFLKLQCLWMASKTSRLSGEIFFQSKSIWGWLYQNGNKYFLKKWYFNYWACMDLNNLCAIYE